MKTWVFLSVKDWRSHSKSLIVCTTKSFALSSSSYGLFRSNNSMDSRQISIKSIINQQHLLKFSFHIKKERLCLQFKITVQRFDICLNQIFCSLLIVIYFIFIHQFYGSKTSLHQLDSWIHICARTFMLHFLRP